ncbi:unnamed protein product [Closterium sp. Yama58-4]|nr:unnamed protein product [Closterium sp. Yama58-4]
MNLTVPSPIFPTLWTPSPSPSPIAEVLSDDHLLSLVLRSLTRDSFHYALVSKRWYAVARRSFTHLTIKFKIQFSVLQDTIRSFSSLTHLELRYCRVSNPNGDAFFQCVGATCPHLTHLTVHYQALMHVTSSGLSSLFHGCRKLRDLRLLTLNYLPHLPPAVSLLSDLTTLHLSRRVGDDHFENLLLPTQSIGALQQLREIRLNTGLSPLEDHPDSTSSLANLPSSIGHLPHLQTLDIVMGVPFIPDSFQHLTSLRSLSLQSKCLARLPEHVMGGMVRLEALSLSGGSLQNLPATICSLPLSSLSIHACPALTSLPHDLGALLQLEALVLVGLRNLSALPESVGDLQRLGSLKIQQVGVLQLPESLCTGRVRHSLERLYLRDCSELRRLPAQLAMLTRLEELEITGCPRLESLEPLLAPHPASPVTCSLASAPSAYPAAPPDPAPASATVVPTATAAGPTAAGPTTACTLPEELRKWPQRVPCLLPGWECGAALALSRAGRLHSRRSIAMGSDDDAAGSEMQSRVAAPLKRKPFKSLHPLNTAAPVPPRQPPLHPAPGSTANPRARFNAPKAAAAVTCNANSAQGAAAAEASAAADETRYYSVMYCPRKPHAKRKGPWSDGLLSVKGRACAVQNMDAKPVAKASVSGCAHLKDGSTLEVGKWEVEVMHEVPREQYLAGSFFIPAAAAAAAAAAVTSAAATGEWAVLLLAGAGSEWVRAAEAGRLAAVRKGCWRTSECDVDEVLHSHLRCHDLQHTRLPGVIFVTTRPPFHFHPCTCASRWAAVAGSALKLSCALLFLPALVPPPQESCEHGESHEAWQRGMAVQEGMVEQNGPPCGNGS